MRTKEEVQGTFYSNDDLKKLILPLIMEQLLAILVGMLDTVMISGVGEAAVSGVSLVDNINILIIQVFAALATGGAVVAGHALGQHNEEAAGRSAWQMVLFLLYASVVTTVVLLGGHKTILGAIFGQVEAEVMSSATTYLIITGLSICPLALYNGCAALFRAMGDSKTTMYISLLMNVMNLVGNAILIFGCNMGVAGAAISTTVSRTTAAGIIFYLLFRPDKVICFKNRVTAKINLEQIKRILYIGIPNGLENSLFQLGKILLLSLVSTFGTSAIAANAVCGTVANFNILPGMAINMAILSVTSFCIGAGDYGQVRYYTKKTDAPDNHLYDSGVSYYDSFVPESAFALSFDTGDGRTGGAGYQIPRSHVYICVGAVLFPAKYTARGGRCDVDDGDCHCIYVDIPNWYSVLFQ